MSRTAVLVGATGLVGRHTLALLVSDPTWERVVTLTRRPLEPASSRHVSHVVDFAAVDFAALDDASALFDCHDLFCALGTTMKQAGSRDAFRRVDFEYVVRSAELAKAQGARQMLLVSAYGSNASSRVFYNRVKGEAEEAVRSLGFEAMHILRPSLLTGDRREKRAGEQIGEAVLNVLSPLMVGPLRPLRPTPAEAVARCLTRAATSDRAGVHIYDPTQIRQLGGSP
ncbi:MAG: NAD(P)H-binding protein [Bacteroidota bacterium]